jgi:hypothetical protein
VRASCKRHLKYAKPGYHKHTTTLFETGDFDGIIPDGLIEATIRLLLQIKRVKEKNQNASEKKRGERHVRAWHSLIDFWMKHKHQENSANQLVGRAQLLSEILQQLQYCGCCLKSWVQLSPCSSSSLNHQHDKASH